MTTVDNPNVSVRQLSLSFGDVPVLANLDLDIGEGEFLVLLGSSGCGKSTLLNCIAGLLDISAGQIFIKGRNVTWDAPKDRGIGMVFQSYALYPQMTVRGNLSFGLKHARVPKADIKARVARAADVLQIESLLDRKPAQLSGGQRQRVAIGRALVREVDVFLFDEPLSNLDAKLRTELRVEIKRLHQRLKNTIIYVTHDQVEAMTLADRIAIMKDGAIQQLDAPQAIYHSPVNRYVADFIGSPSMNFLQGRLHNDRLTVAGFDIPLAAIRSNPERRVSSTDSRVVEVGVRPEHVIHDSRLNETRLHAEVQVDVVEPMGSDTQVWSTLEGQELRFRVDGQSRLQVGDTTTIGIDADSLCLFDIDTGQRF